MRERPAAGGLRHDGEAVNGQRDVNVLVAPTLDTWPICRLGRCLGRGATVASVDDDLELVLRAQRLLKHRHELGPSEHTLRRDDAEPRRGPDGFVMSLVTPVLQGLPLTRTVTARATHEALNSNTHNLGRIPRIARRDRSSNEICPRINRAARRRPVACSVAGRGKCYRSAD